MPIIYRVSQPVQFLKNTIDAEAALRFLAERQLIQIAAQRESFHIMTEDRAPIASELKVNLQREAGPSRAWGRDRFRRPQGHPSAGRCRARV
ncbi:MAG: hypothetical protein WDO13_17600 [Verrucomicrobiota bacterium]